MSSLPHRRHFQCRRVVALAAGLALLGFFCGCSSAERRSPERPFSPERWSPDRPLAPNPAPALAGLAPPEGVDPALWLQLKAALREALAQPQPGSGAREVSDLAISVSGTQADGATAQFSWTYVSGGDYDQNGEVNIGDLTPLGLHFGKTSASPDWAAAAMADGDGNTEINIADVTPIGVNYGARVEGYRLQTAASADASAWTDVSSAPVLLADGALPPGGGPLGFTFDLPDPTDGLYYRVEPYAGSTRGPESNSVLCSVPIGALPPQAALDASPELGPSPLTATFDASASLDPDGGGITHYEWDVDGIPDNGPGADGFEIDGGSEAIIELLWYSLGLHQVRVRVTDDEGATDIEAHSVQVAPGASWHVSFPFGETPKQDNSWECPLIDLNGVPAIAWGYGQVDGAEIRFRRADDAQGSGWTESVLDTGFDRPSGFDMIVGGSKPGIAFAAAKPGGGGIKELWFAWASDALGSAWNPVLAYTPVEVDGVQWLDGVLLAGGAPALISHGIDLLQEVKFCRASSASGLAWLSPVLLPAQPSGGDSGGFVTAASIGGIPALAYFEFGNKDLLYCSAQSAGGSAWDPVVTIDNLENVGLRPRLAEVAGQPAIGYFNDTQRALQYVRALDADGSAWGQPLVLDGQALGLQAVAVVNERPAIAYAAHESGRLRFISAVDVEGRVWDAWQDADALATFSALVSGGRQDIQLIGSGGLVQIAYTVNSGGGAAFKFACLH